MRFGLHLPNSGPLTAAADLVAMAVRAEQLGLDAVWVYDHLFNPVELSAATRAHRPTYYNHADMPYYDALTTLGVVAGATSRITLGTRVLLPVLRSPVVLAKQLGTLARLAGPGRLVIGVGAGWLIEEFEAVGIDPGERFARLDEHVAVMRGIWEQGIVGHRGDFYAHPPAGFHPLPQAPIPVLLGGSGPATLRRVARWADGWAVPNVEPGPSAPAELHDLFARLDAACRAESRDRAELRLVVGAPLSAPIEHFELLHDLGVDAVDLVLATEEQLDLRELTGFVETVMERFR